MSEHDLTDVGSESEKKLDSSELLRASDDPAVRAKEVERYMPLIEKVVDRLSYRFSSLIERSDMISIAAIGLYKAIEKYEPGALSFQQYAEIRIRGEVLDELRKRDLVSRSSRRKTKHYQETVRKLRHTLGEEPTAYDVANEMGISVEEAEIIRDQTKPIRMTNVESMEIEENNPFVKQERGSSVEHNPYDEAHEEQTKELVRQALSQLPERERMVLHLYYFEDLTLRSIGQILGMSEARVSQIHIKACEALKEVIKGDREKLMDML